MKKPSVEEAERLMKADKIRAYGVDPQSGEVDSVKTWDDHWVLFKQPKPQGGTDG